MTKTSIRYAREKDRKKKEREGEREKDRRREICKRDRER